MSELRPRIIGTEMEWPMAVWYEGDKAPKQFETPGAIQQSLPEGVIAGGISQSNSMLSNGARYYVDVGQRVEYATPETTSFDDLVTREMAGERIVAYGVSEHAQNNEKIQMMTLSKRVTDAQESGWGYHLSLSADSNRIGEVNDATMHLLGLHLATSAAMLGAGTVYYDEKRMLQYSFHQKALSLTKDYSSGTTTTKPVINQRNEPLMKNVDLRRIHVTSTDAHISPWSTKMNVGTVSLVLRAIEQAKGRKLRLAGSSDDGTTLTQLFRQTATDISMQQAAELEGIGTITALGIQEKIVEVVETTDHTDEEAEILSEWKRAIEILQRNPLELQESDAMAQLSLMTAWKRRKGIEDDGDFNHEELLKISDLNTRLLTYRQPTTEQGGLTALDLYRRSRAAVLREHLFSAHMPSEQAIEDAVVSPPRTTRAFGRGNAMRRGKGVVAANWSSYTLKGQKKEIRIDDPYIPDITVAHWLANK